MSRKFPFTQQLNQLECDRFNDEVAIARHLQASGMKWSDALIVAAEHVSLRLKKGYDIGGIVSVDRPVGDNGGPPLTD